MKPFGLLILALLAATFSAFSQVRQDSSFSLLFNSGISFTHANDPHINRWLAKYGYPTEPHTPSSINFELAAIPTNSRLLYSIRLSSINSGSNLSSYNAMLGLFTALAKSKTFLLYAGGSVGLHGDIIRLNGNVPAEYQQLDKYNDPLALRRRGPVLEPAVRALWYPVRIHSRSASTAAWVTISTSTHNGNWAIIATTTGNTVISEAWLNPMTRNA